MNGAIGLIHFDPFTVSYIRKITFYLSSQQLSCLNSADNKPQEYGKQSDLP